jgi:hypothetical protein
MTSRIAYHSNYRLSMSLAGIVAIVIPLATAPHLRAQSQDTAPSFEAASIKPTQMTGQGTSIDRHPGMLVMKNVTLQDCIREAYGVTDSQITGQNLLSLDRYDIVAKIPPGVTTDRHPAMLQALLAERFKLAVHHGTREMPVYLLVVAKNGPKIQAAQSLEWAPDDKQGADTQGPSLPAALQEQLGLKLETGKAPMEILVIDHAENPPKTEAHYPDRVRLLRGADRLLQVPNQIVHIFDANRNPHQILTYAGIDLLLVVQLLMRG